MFRFFEYISQELKAFQNKLAERSYASSKERLSRLILALDRLQLELSRAELAEMAGVSSKTAIRTLGELEARGSCPSTTAGFPSSRRTTSSA